MPVDWGKSLVYDAKQPPEIRPENQLWVDLCKPDRSARVVGNRQAIDQLNDWFSQRRREPSGNAFLVVKGPSGVGKSTVVNLCANEHGFNVVHTYANVPRTPQKIDSVFRQLTMKGGEHNALVLDDFESFISETTSVRDLVKVARSCQRTGSGGEWPSNITIVAICNETDRSFQSLFNISKLIEFERPGPADVAKVLHRLTNYVSKGAYIPPMDAFFVAHGARGNICQTINQCQFSFAGTAKPKKQTKTILKRIQVKSQADSAFKNWSTTHRSSSIDCFVRSDDDILDSIWAMSKGFHMDVRENLHREYLLYFHDSSAKSLKSMWRVSEEVSASDTYVPDEEDALYSTENSECWARDNSFGVGHMSTGICEIRGRKRGDYLKKRRKIGKRFEYN